MSFKIVRNDITKMKVDAIVNTANPEPVVGYGLDQGIHQKSGPELLKARQKIGEIKIGQAAITPAFGLDAKFVIHAVGPVWQGGTSDEEKHLRDTYLNILKLATKYHCMSVALPLMSTGNYGFPKSKALKIAVEVIRNFLRDNDTEIYLVIFGKEEMLLSEKLFSEVRSYIDENYVKEKFKEEYKTERPTELRDVSGQISRYNLLGEANHSYEQFTLKEPLAIDEGSIAKLLDNLDASFSETLLKLIDKTGKKDSEIYKKANVDRKLFSKIRTNKDYRPTKKTAIAFALALELDIKETEELISRAGYTLSHSNKFDIIVEYFILHRNYDIYELNEVLFTFDQPIIG